jgi:hypothetical protein
MPGQIIKLIHAFSALASLGEEIAESRDFDDMVRSTLHVVLGALGIRRGAVAEYERAAGALRLVGRRAGATSCRSKMRPPSTLCRTAWARS